MPDFRQAEIAYFNEVGYVPGIHLLGIKPAARRRASLASAALSEILDESARIWLEKRRRYADTTPWIIDELAPGGARSSGELEQADFEAEPPDDRRFPAEIHAAEPRRHRSHAGDLFPRASLSQCQQEEHRHESRPGQFAVSREWQENAETCVA